MAYEDRYLEFENNYKRTDLSLVDNGEFLPKLLSMRKNAIDLLLEARKTDLALSSDNEESLDEAYTKYDTAFIECSAVYELINDSYKKLENLRKKAILRDFISVSGYVVGITGIILSIVFYFFPFQ
ncbi:MAG: hypothetical protein FWE59_04310 [Oscillospiraceae bacterium]|nr:hypothetical protein [Oscillospiraceae bacterium]